MLLFVISMPANLHTLIKYTYSASVKFPASFLSFISAGQSASLSLRKLTLSNSFPFWVLKRSYAGRELPYMNSLFIEFPVIFANDYPNIFSDFILGT